MRAAVQGGGAEAAPRALFCKGGLLRITALLLLAHDGPAAAPEMQDALRRFLRVLLLGKVAAEREQRSAAAVPAESVLLAAFDEVVALRSCDLSAWWQHQQVRARPARPLCVTANRRCRG